MDAELLLPLRVEGTPPPWGHRRYRLEGLSMGTSWSVLFVGPQGLRLAPVEQALQRTLDAVVAEMSHWEPDSLLSRFNRSAAGSRHALPPGFASVIDAALQIAASTDGAFDPTVGDLVSRWGFGPPGALQDALCDWRALHWDGHLLTQPGRARLDLSAIAKGHAVDRVAQRLDELGLPHHLVEIGGELRGNGFKPDGQPWWVDIEPPADHASLVPLRIALHGLAIASSGDYRRYVMDEQGRRLAHTVVPRGGEPVAHGLAAVSVVHESAMWADGWSTALMVMGLERGLAFAAHHGLAAYFVQRAGDGFETRYSPALEALRA